MSSARRDMGVGVTHSVPVAAESRSLGRAVEAGSPAPPISADVPSQPHRPAIAIYVPFSVLGAAVLPAHLPLPIDVPGPLGPAGFLVGGRSSRRDWRAWTPCARGGFGLAGGRTVSCSGESARTVGVHRRDPPFDHVLRSPEWDFVLVLIVQFVSLEKTVWVPAEVEIAAGSSRVVVD